MHRKACWAEGTAHAGHIALRPRRPSFMRRDRLQGDDTGQHPPGLAANAAHKQCPCGNREVVAAQPGVAQAGIGGPSVLTEHPGRAG